LLSDSSPRKHEEESVQPVYLFTLASQHERWASVREAALTSNIANANTRGYTAVDIQPFSAVLDDTSQVSLTRTERGHLGASGEADDPAARDWQVRQTDKPVAIEEQLMAADETSRGFALDTSVVRAFHRMLLSAVRSA
jgi:flagellar basal-body rod protein FlgB